MSPSEMTQVSRQHLHTVVITQLVGYLCSVGEAATQGVVEGRTPSDPWPPRSPRSSLGS